MIKWLIRKWIFRECRHFCRLCRFRKRCEYERKQQKKYPRK